MLLSGIGLLGHSRANMYVCLWLQTMTEYGQCKSRSHVAETGVGDVDHYYNRRYHVSAMPCKLDF